MEEMEKRKKRILDLVVCVFLIELPIFPSFAIFNIQKLNLFKSKDIIQFEKEWVVIASKNMPEK